MNSVVSSSSPRPQTHVPALRGALLAVLERVGPQMGFDLAAIAAIAERAAVTSWRAGRRICCPNDRDAFFHIVLRGSVQIVCNVPGSPQSIVSLLGPGRFFGLGSTFDPPGPRMMGAVAHEDCVVAILSHEQAMAVFAGMPSASIMRTLAFTWRGLSSLVYHKNRALMLPLEERVMAELRQLAIDFGRPHRRGRVIDVSLKQIDLASLAVCSRSVVGRALAKLRQAGLVDAEGDRIVLLDPTVVATPVDEGDATPAQCSSGCDITMRRNDGDLPGARRVPSA